MGDDTVRANHSTPPNHRARRSPQNENAPADPNIILDHDAALFAASYALNPNLSTVLVGYRRHHRQRIGVQQTAVTDKTDWKPRILRQGNRCADSQLLCARALVEWQAVERLFGDCLDELREIY